MRCVWVSCRAANSNFNLNSKLKILWDSNLNSNSKYLKQARVNFYLYNITTTDFKKNEIFSLEIKDLMLKVGLSQYLSYIV